MATKQIQKNRKNSAGGFDVIHYETDASIVLMEDGSSVEEAMKSKQDSLSARQEVGAVQSGDKMVVIRNGAVYLAPPSISADTSGGGGTAASSGLFMFNIDDNGDLILYYNGDEAPSFFINNDGDLIAGFEDGNTLNIGHVVGTNGSDGEKGAPFTYEDFTPEQLASLKGKDGEKGAPFTYEDFTPEQLAALKGDAGSDGISPTVTIEQIGKTISITVEDITGTTTKSFTVPDGQDGATYIPTVDADGNLIWTNSKDQTTTQPVNIKGDPFTYEDFTEEQLAALKGVSPTVTIEQTGKTVSITVEDITGTVTKSFTVPDGVLTWGSF